MSRATRIATVAVLVALLAPASAGAASLAVQQVDTARYPEISVRVALPGTLVATKARPRFEVAENGRDIAEVRSSPVKADPTKSYTVLVIDTSGSMQGQAIVDARTAAARFIDEMGSGAQIAVVAFSDEPKIVTGFTDDRVDLQAAIDSLAARGETAVYDALVTAASLVPDDKQALKSIVLLSDGGDTVSDRTLPAAVEAVRKSGAPVYAISLKTKESSRKALSIIAQDSAGRLVPVARSAELGGLFEGIARELKDVWVLTYRSNEPSTKEIEVDIAAIAGDRTASTPYVFENPAFAQVGSEARLRIPDVRADTRLLVGAVALSFLAMSVFAVGVLLLVMRQNTGLEQLRYYDQLQADSDEAHVPGVTDKVRSGINDAVGYVAGRRGLTKLVSTSLERAGLPLRAVEYMSAHVIGVVAIGFITQLLVGRLVLSVLMIVLATLLPILFLVSAIERRRHGFEDQLPDVLTMIAGSLRGGWGIQQAIDLVVQEAMPPASIEFKRVQTETRLGMPLEQSLMAMADRLESDDFRAVVTAVTIQREVGGNLAEVLDVVAGTVRDRGALRRQVSALTAEGRLSAIILIILPIIEAVALTFISPGYLEPLYTTLFGAVSLVVGVVLMVVGSIWLIKATKIEV